MRGLGRAPSRRVGPVGRMAALAGALTLGAGLALAAGLSARGEEAIRGDFGLTLGQIFDQGLALGSVTLAGNIEAQRFNPAYPLYLFRDYYAVVTPRSRLVGGIVAHSVEFSTMQECVTQLNAVQAFLGRFGVPRMTSQSDREVLVQVEQGNRAAYLRCNRAQNIRMELNYTDYDVLRLRDQEVRAK